MKGRQPYVGATPDFFAPDFFEECWLLSWQEAAQMGSRLVAELPRGPWSGRRVVHECVAHTESTAGCCKYDGNGGERHLPPTTPVGPDFDEVISEIRLEIAWARYEGDVGLVTTLEQDLAWWETLRATGWQRGRKRA